MIDFEIIKKQNNLITNNGLIYVKPIDEYQFITFPIEDLSGALAITLEQYLGLRANYYKFNKDLNGLEINTINV